MPTKPTTSKPTETLSRHDRDMLLKHAAEREKVAKTTAQRRSSDMLAQLEVEMAQHYARQDNEVFDRVTRVLAVAVEEAQRQIDAECVRLQIPARFRPRVRASWDPGGATEGERKLLLAIAQRQAKAQELRGYEEIEKAVVKAKAAIIAASFDAKVALDALGALPAVESLIPPMHFRDIEALFKRDPQRMIDEYNASQKDQRGRIPYGARIDASEVYSIPDKDVNPDDADSPSVPRIGSPWAGEDE
jgi:hypothetical protein